MGSRGCDGNKLGELWRKGPPWLEEENLWPEDIVTSATEETEAEAVKIKEVLATAVTYQEGQMDSLLEKFSYWKLLRITAWTLRFW